MNRQINQVTHMQRLLLLLALFLPICTGLAQEVNGINPLDIAKIQSVTDAQLSPDGRYVAFVRSVPADPLKENKPASSHLFMYDREAEQTIPFFTRASVRGVAFRPGTSSITFLARMPEDATTTLYEMPLRGGEATPLLRFETSLAAYDWAQDGNRLVFRANEPASKEENDLPYQPIVYEENLSFTRAYMVDLSTEEAPKMIDVAGDVNRAQWSPSGDRLVIMAAPTPLVDDFYMAQSVSIVDANTQKVVAEVDHRGKKGELAWSPDGSKLAMIAAATVNDPIDGRLFVVDATGGAPDNLQPEFPGAFEEIAWIDENTIQFLASEGVESTMGTIRADGSNLQRLFQKKGSQINGFDRGAAGTLALVMATAQHPAEVFLLEQNTESPQRITDSNPWLQKEAMGRQAVFTYEARDGLELQGILIYPVNYEEGQRYPLVTVVHGGPEAHYDNGWLTGYSTGGQMLAADGYVVFYPNYRGSTGRGVEFAMSSQGDLAGREFDDVVDGVDRLIEMGLVDEEKVGVTGGSYGGYATGWMATRYTDRFAAGVMFVGISDNISKWGTSDIPEELYLVHSRKRIWEDYEFFLQRSPIFYADQAKTPLLIMAGAEDTRVDPSQSMELYRHIKTRTDTPVRLILYPGEGHGNRNASARLDYSRRMKGWFDQFLKDEVVRP